MWILRLTLPVVSTLLYLGMWRGRHLCRSVSLLCCPFTATAHSLRKPAFVMAGGGRYRHATMEEGSRSPSGGNRRQKRSLTQVPLRSGSRSHRNQLCSERIAQEVLQGKVRPGRCALHSSSAQECGGVMGHIEEHLLRVATTKGSPNQLVALRSLKLLIEHDPNCIKHLLRFNILDVLVKVLQQPYKKNLWELMNSYIWSGSSAETMHLKMLQDTVLSTLIMLARRSGSIRSRMAKDEHFKSLLMRIYLCEMKSNKNGDVTKAVVKSTNDLSQQVGSVSANTTPSNGSQDTATDSHAPNSDTGKDGIQSHEINGTIGAVNSDQNNRDDSVPREEGTSCDTQVLLRDLFHSFGYEINEDSVMKRYERVIESSGTNDNAVYDTGGLVAHCEGLDVTQKSTTSEDASHITTETDNLSHEYDGAESYTTTTIWIPYVFRRKDGNAIEAIRRHLHINIEEKPVEIVNLDALPTITIDNAGDAAGDLVFGMVALSSNRSTVHRTTGGQFNQPFSTKTDSSQSTNGRLYDVNGYRYAVISNVQITASDHLNAQTLASNLLGRLGTVSSFEVLNDIVRELWMLIGSKDKHVLELVHRDLDLERVADIIDKSLVHTMSDLQHMVETKAKHERNVLHEIFDNLRHKLSSYISAVMSTSLGLAEKWKRNDCADDSSQDDSLVKTDTLDTKLNKLNAVAETVTNGTDPGCTVDSTQGRVARQLQTAVFGLLIDMIYMNGNLSICAIRDCLPLVDALKKARAGFPPLSKFVDIVDSDLENFCSILDKRENNVLNETNVIHKDLGKGEKEDVGELQSRDRDEFGNILSSIHMWTEESWMRQKCADRSALGAVFNCHKLLNILGHHDQQRFKNRGVRILSIDGGGSKGVVALEILRKLETTLGKPLHEAFDIICGTSCGGLLGALIALEKARVTDVQTLFESLMSKVFKRDSYRVTGTRLLMRQAYYDEGVLYESLRRCFGKMELIDYSIDPACPKFFCLSVQMDVSPLKPIIWRNYNYPPEACIISNCDNHTPPRDGSFAIHAADAIRATTAAPMYFPLLERNGSLYGDGALHANNPSLIAMLEAKLVYPNVPIECIVSVGTGCTREVPGKRKADTDLGSGSKKGRTGDNPSTQSETSSMEENVPPVGELETPDGDSQIGTFDIKDVLLRSLSMPASNDPKSLGLDQLINHVISSATSTEAVHMALQTLMESSKYFRFNPPIPAVPLDDTTPEVLSDLKQRTQRYLEEERQRKRMARIGNMLKCDP